MVVVVVVVVVMLIVAVVEIALHIVLVFKGISQYAKMLLARLGVCYLVALWDLSKVLSHRLHVVVVCKIFHNTINNDIRSETVRAFEI